MKKTNILMVSMCALFIMSSQSCSNDEGTPPDDEGEKTTKEEKKEETKSKTLKGESTVLISFENFIGDNKIKINDNIDYMTSSEGQTIKKVTAFDYIVSNFTLIDETGKPFVYPKDKSYFIISEEGRDDETKKKKSVEALLEDIPAGDYTSMTFILGVDYDKWKSGDLQDDLWQQATHYAMTWPWAAGYKNLRFEGLLSNKTIGTLLFMLHIGNDAGYKAKNYRTITLNFPSDHPLSVSEDLQGKIDIHVNAEKLLDGKNKNEIPKLADDSMFSIMMGTSKFADNMTEMFTIKSVESKETEKQ